jgi:hypothetical protein
MCYILCMSKRGGAGGWSPPHGGLGAAPPKKIFLGRHIFAGFGPTYFWDDIFSGPHDIRWFSAHGFLPMVFYFWLRN